MNNLMDNERLKALEDLLNFSLTTTELSKNLRSFSWDYDGEPVIILRIHVLDVLNRFIAGEIHSKEIENWANLIECREDLDAEHDFTKEINDVIFKLANPILEGELSIEFCSKLTGELSHKK